MLFNESKIILNLRQALDDHRLFMDVLLNWQYALQMYCIVKHAITLVKCDFMMHGHLRKPHFMFL